MAKTCLTELGHVNTGKYPRGRNLEGHRWVVQSRRVRFIDSTTKSGNMAKILMVLETDDMQHRFTASTS